MESSFEALQDRLKDHLGRGGLGDMTAGTIVVLPSISFATTELVKITGITRYEERLLCLLLLLREPGLKMVYATALPIDPTVIDYYLGFLDDVDARERLSLVTLDDPEPRGLTAKILERPDIIEEIETLSEGAAVVVPFNVTEAEAEFCLRTGIPLLGPAVPLVELGTKSGSRKVALRASVPTLDGAEDIASADHLEKEIRALIDRRPSVRSVVAKLNHGFSGQGNVIIEVDDLGSPVDHTPAVFCADGETWETYLPKLAAEGGIVEEHIRAVGEPVSPSVQLYVSPAGTVEVLSTHDQILGGPDGQVYLGCRFPAAELYRADIQHFAERVGHVLARDGVVGSFGVDFIIVPQDDGERAFLSEINLRMGGTTHPFLMAKYLTGGTYDEQTGELMASGERVAYMATDNLKADAYKSLTPAALIRGLRGCGSCVRPCGGDGDNTSPPRCAPGPREAGGGVHRQIYRGRGCPLPPAVGGSRTVMSLVILGGRPATSTV